MPGEPAGLLEVSGITSVSQALETSVNTDAHKAPEFHRDLPAELSTLRRQIYERIPTASLRPVPIARSVARGVNAGYYMTPLRDGSSGYLQRRPDDCLQAALASCLQIPPHKIPDLHLDELLDDWQGSRGDRAAQPPGDESVGAGCDGHGSLAAPDPEPSLDWRREGGWG